MLVRCHRLTLLLDVATCDARLVGGVDHHRLPDDATKTESRAQRKNLYQDIGVRWVSRHSLGWKLYLWSPKREISSSM